MTAFKNYKMEEKLSLLSELVKMARIDSEISHMELSFIQQIAAMLDVEKDYVMALIDENIAYKAPKTEFERILQFHRLVLLANVDLQIESEEIMALQKAGIKLGLRPEAINAVLMEMVKHQHGMIPTERILQIFTAYHN
tara:strand:+ start:3319 stop:3735 length:417 start_codon:yes stop_codon:yes gene_type:complete